MVLKLSDHPLDNLRSNRVQKPISSLLLKDSRRINNMSSSSVSVVAIAGLTGRMSRSIANHILQTKQDVMIHGIMRDPSKLPANLKDSPNVKTFQAAADEKEKLRKALQGADVCICGYSGGKDVILDGQKTLIDACIESGVKRYIASDWSIDYRDLVSILALYSL